MNTEDLNDLNKYIKEKQKENISAKIDMYKEFLYLLINPLLQKGLKENFLQELIKIKNEYINIINCDTELMKKILCNANKYNSEAVDILLDKLDILMEKTVRYYYNLIDDYESELSIERNHPYKKIPKKIATLIDSEIYYKEVQGLSLTIDDIKDYLNYDNNFWNFIFSKTKIITNPYDNYDSKIDLYGVWHNNNLNSIKICVPEVIDLKTAQIAIHEFRHAHDLYLNKFFNDNLEQEAMSEEQKFKENYYKLKKHYHK